MDVNIIAIINIFISLGIKLGLIALIIWGIITIKKLNRKIEKINGKIENFEIKKGL